MTVTLAHCAECGKPGYIEFGYTGAPLCGLCDGSRPRQESIPTIPPPAPHELHVDSQVRDFHEVMDQPILERPAVPPPERVRLRCRLVIEEALEVLAACGVPVDEIRMQAFVLIERFAGSSVDLPGVARELADTDYVVAGTRLEFGITGAPIADAVHAANMTKASGGRSPEGKILKPPGWQPPDIAGLLRAQGWKPEGASQ